MLVIEFYWPEFHFQAIWKNVTFLSNVEVDGFQKLGLASPIIETKTYDNVYLGFISGTCSISTKLYVILSCNASFSSYFRENGCMKVVTLPLMLLAPLFLNHQ